MMKSDNYDIKLQACNLSDALHRNINDNFESVSFQVSDDGVIKIKIVLNKRTKAEDEYIDDLITEFEALQEKNIVNEVITDLGVNLPCFENVVYRKKASKLKG